MDKGIYIKYIINYIRGLSGTNYQSAVGKILAEHYHGRKTFEMPSPFGGDDKNDGWVVEDGIFYQIYSPIQFSSSFVQEVKDKFSNDLHGLLDLVYNKNKWNGVVNKFIFIVNTRDTSLPKDPDRFYDGQLTRFIAEFGIKNDITQMVCNDDYIFDLLFEENEIKLERIATKLEIIGLINCNQTSRTDIIKFIDSVAEKLQETALTTSASDYKRISTNKKIDINGLQSLKNHILDIMPKLSVVDAAIENYFTRSIEAGQSFEIVKNFYIEKYNELAISYSGEELYGEMLRQILDFAPSLEVYRIPAEMVLLYIFDRCDIFKKDVSV